MSSESGMPSSPLRPEDIENADHAVLKRLLGESGVPSSSRSYHSSHSSGTGRGHSSYVSSMTPQANEQAE
jgi:hypothetical protein